MKNYLLDLCKFFSRIIAIGIFLSFFCLDMCKTVNAQGIYAQETIYQTQDIQVFVRYYFFYKNYVGCENISTSIIRVEVSIPGLVTTTTVINPGSTPFLYLYDQCKGKYATLKYWKYQSPLSTSNTQWLYCGEHYFYIE